MLFIWHPAKAEINARKHRISFGLAQTIFDDPLHVSVLDRKARHEERWVTVGQSANKNTLVVVHTYSVEQKGLEVIRIISARRATRREKKHYEKGI